MKQLRYSPEAAKALTRHANMRNRIRRALQEYAADSSAHANGVTQLVGLTAKRMRIGNFRAIFEEAGDDILVTRIGPRGSVYDE